MNSTDLLQLKIEEAKQQLSRETLAAIEAVLWQDTILQMRETKGYTFEQLGDLETETELLLAGLLSSEAYPQELENRMRITKVQANDLVKEMNEKVFSKIKEELIKISEQGKPSENKKGGAGQLIQNEEAVLSSAGIEILNGDSRHKEAGLPVVEKLELAAKPVPLAEKEVPHSILTQKLSGSVQNKEVTTEHSPENLTKPTLSQSYPKGTDPYRLPLE